MPFILDSWSEQQPCLPRLIERLQINEFLYSSQQASRAVTRDGTDPASYLRQPQAERSHGNLRAFYVQARNPVPMLVEKITQLWHDCGMYAVQPRARAFGCSANTTPLSSVRRFARKVVMRKWSAGTCWRCYTLPKCNQTCTSRTAGSTAILPRDTLRTLFLHD